MNISTVKRPWGSFERLTHNELSTVKLIYVSKGEETSLQYHHKREEFWKIISGHPCLVIGDDIINSKVGEEYTVLSEKKHRISAPNDDIILLEISTGDFDEDDIVRVEDKYNRI